MKLHILIVAVLTAGLAFTGCQKKSKKENPSKVGTPTPTPTPTPKKKVPTPTPAPEEVILDNIPSSSTNPAPTPAVRDLRPGIRTEREGFVKSPDSGEGGGLIDVRGFAPGTEVKDPYTGKVFLVP